MIAFSSLSKAELIILATPIEDDPYYESVLDDIVDFHVNYANIIRKNGDQVLIFSNDLLYDTYVDALGAKNVARIEMFDIWMRDFSPLNASSPIMFQYSAAGREEAKKTQMKFKTF